MDPALQPYRRAGAPSMSALALFLREIQQNREMTAKEKLRGLLGYGLHAAPGGGALLLGGDAFRNLKNGDGSDKLPHAGRVKVHDRAALIALDNGATPIF